MRWRNVKDAEGNDVLDEEGNPVRQSNARFVKWSDGRCVPVKLYSPGSAVTCIALQIQYKCC